MLLHVHYLTQPDSSHSVFGQNLDQLGSQKLHTLIQLKMIGNVSYIFQNSDYVNNSKSDINPIKTLKSLHPHHKYKRSIQLTQLYFTFSQFFHRFGISEGIKLRQYYWSLTNISSSHLQLFITVTAMISATLHILSKCMLKSELIKHTSE